MFFKPIYVCSTAATAAGGGAMTAVTTSQLRYVSMFYWLCVSSIVVGYARSYGHISKSTQNPKKNYVTA